MSVLKVNDRYIDGRSKEFVVMKVEDDMVWYTDLEVMYSCRPEAFLERFTLIENHS
jgi:hypothetical protein